MPRGITSLEDADIAISQLIDFKDELTSLNMDMRRRRVVNAGPSIDPFDYVIRGEVTDLVNESIQALDFNELIDIGRGGGTGLQNPLKESILASIDSQYDIGERNPGKRIRWGFADVWNGVEIEIENTDNDAFWTLGLEAVTDSLEFRTPGDANILRLNAASIEVEVDVLPADALTQSVGDVSKPFDDMWAGSFELDGFSATTSSGRLIANQSFPNSYGELRLGNSPLTPGVVTEQILVRATSLGARIELDDSSEDRIIVISAEGDGQIDVYPTGEPLLPYVRLDASSADGGLVRVYDSSATPIRKADLYVDSGGNGAINLEDTATGGIGGFVLKAINVTVANQAQIDTDFVPSSDKTKELGLDTRRWDKFWGEDIDIEGTFEGGALIKAVDATTADCQSIVGANSAVLRGSSTAGLNGVYVNGTQVLGPQETDPGASPTTDELRTVLLNHGLIG